MSGIHLSNATFLVALFAYFAVMVASFGLLAYGKDVWRRVAVGVCAFGVVAHAASLLAITFALHRAPWGSMYEFTSASGLVIMATTLGLILWRRTHAVLTGFLAGFSTLLMGAGWMVYSEPGPLQPALRSNWLTFHVMMAIAGSSLLLAASVVSALYLIRLRWEEPGWSPAESPHSAEDLVPDRVVDEAEEAPDAVVALAGAGAAPREGPGAKLATAPAGGLGARLPSSERLDDLARKLVTFAFPIWTTAIIAGAIWGEQAWGRYWGWDPKETASFIIWAVYAVYLHARATAGWKGRRAAKIAVAGGAALVANLFVVNIVVSGLHSYAK